MVWLFGNAPGEATFCSISSLLGGAKGGTKPAMFGMYWQSANCRLSISLAWNKDFLSINRREIVIFRLSAVLNNRE
jgi:hypothetical protein